MTVLIIGVYGIIAYFQSAALIRKKEWRDLIVSSVLLAIAFTLTLLYAAGVKLPDLMNLAAELFDSMHLKMDVK